MYLRYAEEAGLVVDMVIDAGQLLACREKIKEQRELLKAGKRTRGMSPKLLMRLALSSLY